MKFWGYIIRSLCFLLSFLPTCFHLILAKILAFFIIHCSARAYNRIQTNLLLTNLADDHNIKQLAQRTVLHFCLTIVEMLLLVWTHRYKDQNIMIDDDSDAILKNCSQQKTLFISPHLGNFQLASHYITNHYQIKIQILYKPTKIKILNWLMKKGLEKDGVKLCSVTNKKEILRTIKNFKNGIPSIGMLPDAISAQNNGVWVNFFKQPIFSTSLAGNLSLMSNTKVCLIFCVRNDSGHQVFAQELINQKRKTNITVQEQVQLIYQHIEVMVKKYPNQYYWSYDRFRIPKYIKS